MGIIVSPTEKEQFIEGLKYARSDEGGWSDADIARSLSVSNGDFKNMLTGHKPPSQKHVDRLNNLLHSSPPKRLTSPPPAPSKPAMALPDFTTQKPERPKTQVLYVGDDGGAPRTAAPQATVAPTASAPEPPKESTDMTTTQTTNGVSHGTKKPPAHVTNGGAMDNRRYRLLPPAEAKALKKAMKVALEEKYEGDRKKLADALSMTTHGLAKGVFGPGSISELTRDRFAKLTGWAFSSQSSKPAAKPPKRGARGSRTPLSKTDASTFKREIEAAIELAGGNMSKLARGMGVDRNTIANIVNGEGGSEETREKFRAYRARLSGTIAEPRNATPKRKLLDEYGPSERSAEPTPADPLDLYGMAGRLLLQGRVAHAHLLSLVAKIMEGPGVERVNDVLRKLLPQAAVG